MTGSESLRVFYGVRVPHSDALGSVLEDLSELGAGVRPVRADQFHMTLKFVGEVTRGTVEGLKEVLAATAARHTAFTLRLTGLGAFPNMRRPSVVWVGTAGAPEHAGGELLTAMADDLDRAVEPLGIARETRPYHPHLTLARVKGRTPPELLHWLQQHADTDFGTCRVDTLELIRSSLNPNGAIYSEIATARLNPASAHPG